MVKTVFFIVFSIGILSNVAYSQDQKQAAVSYEVKFESDSQAYLSFKIKDKNAVKLEVRQNDPTPSVIQTIQIEKKTTKTENLPLGFYTIVITDASNTALYVEHIEIKR